jgi:hypothetical protein
LKECSVFPRIREIVDPFGLRLRVCVEPHLTGALVSIERPDLSSNPRICLDPYGAEILSGYIMASRLALPHDLPGESVRGAFACELRFLREPKVSIELEQAGQGALLDIPATFWDKLYAELCLVIPHVRELGRTAVRTVH